MKYNAKYNRWVSKNGIIYRYDEQHDKLVVCAVNDNGKGYDKVFVGFKNNKQQMEYVHRIVYETFKGNIPAKYVIDHINHNPHDNDADNLQCVSYQENIKLAYTRDGYIGKSIQHSDFGRMLFDTLGITKKNNIKEYRRQRYYWKRYGHLVEDN